MTIDQIDPEELAIARQLIAEIKRDIDAAVSPSLARIATVVIGQALTRSVRLDSAESICARDTLAALSPTDTV